jgi:N-acetylglucosaminyldiphosphoundecaprenol N-acetyl-beta-D-mannosaminyltransferase
MTATEILRRRYPGLEIAGRSNGYVKEEHMPDLIDQINKSKAEILFLALGSPKQEIWFARNRHSLENVKICQGIGGSLDTIAGNVKRAPAIWRKCSAEWLYRLIKEPKRIKRQRVLPLFVLMVLSRKVSSGFRSSNKGTPR